MNRATLFVMMLMMGIFFLESSTGASADPQPVAAAQYTEQNSKDPFTVVADHKSEGPPSVVSTAPNEPPPLVLDGVIWVPEKPRAVINGKRLLVGDVIEDAKVLEIHKKDVKIKFNEQEFTLKPQKRNLA